MKSDLALALGEVANSHGADRDCEQEFFQDGMPVRSDLLCYHDGTGSRKVLDTGDD